MHLIGTMGQNGKLAVTPLKAFLQSKIPPERMVSSWALVQISNDPEILALAKPGLIDAMANDNPEVRIEIANSLAEHYPSDPEVRKTLQNASDDENEDVRKAIQSAIKKLDK